jgi:muconolactone delta-isomerase
MKFLLTIRNRDLHYSLPEKDRVFASEKRIAFIEGNLQKGKCKGAYFDPDFKGSFSIWDFDTNEDAGQVILEIPGRDHVDIDIKPVMEFDVAVKQMRMFFEIVMKD